MVKVICAVLALTFSYNPVAEAGILKRMMFGAGVLGVGAMAYQSTKHTTKHKKSDDGPGSDSQDSYSYGVDATVITKTPKGADILRENLNNDRQASGMSPLLPPDCEPHHIVPEGDNRKGIKEYAEPARKLLEKCEIDINSSVNGIFLPYREGVQGCEGDQNHRSIHKGKLYYRPVLDRLTQGFNDGGCQGVKDALVEIKRVLVNGGMP